MFGPLDAFLGPESHRHFPMNTSSTTPIANETGTTVGPQGFPTMADPRRSRTGFVASFSQILGLFLQSSAATLLQTAHSNSSGPKPPLKTAAAQRAASNSAV